MAETAILRPTEVMWFHVALAGLRTHSRANRNIVLVGFGGGICGKPMHLIIYQFFFYQQGFPSMETLQTKRPHLYSVSELNLPSFLSSGSRFSSGNFLTFFLPPLPLQEHPSLLLHHLSRHLVFFFIEFFYFFKKAIGLWDWIKGTDKGSCLHIGYKR